MVWLTCFCTECPQGNTGAGVAMGTHKRRSAMHYAWVLGPIDLRRKGPSIVIKDSCCAPDQALVECSWNSATTCALCAELGQTLLSSHQVEFLSLRSFPSRPRLEVIVVGA